MSRQGRKYSDDDICEVEGCTFKAKVRRKCKKHYKREIRAEKHQEIIRLKAENTHLMAENAELMEGNNRKNLLFLVKYLHHQ